MPQCGDGGSGRRGAGGVVCSQSAAAAASRDSSREMLAWPPVCANRSQRLPWRLYCAANRHLQCCWHRTGRAGVSGQAGTGQARTSMVCSLPPGILSVTCRGRSAAGAQITQPSRESRHWRLGSSQPDSHLVGLGHNPHGAGRGPPAASPAALAAQGSHPAPRPGAAGEQAGGGHVRGRGGLGARYGVWTAVECKLGGGFGSRRQKKSIASKAVAPHPALRDGTNDVCATVAPGL